MALPDHTSETGSTASVARASAAVRKASLGRALVAVAVFAPALFILGLFLFSQGHIYGYKVHGAKWPWIVADVAVLGIGVLLMREEDL